MRMDKYNITNNSMDITECGKTITVYQIRAKEDFGDVCEGDLGGWVESEENLSQEGDCWLYDDAIACLGSVVRGNAKMYDYSMVKDKSIVEGNARIYGNVDISNKCIIGGNAVLGDDIVVCDNTTISENYVIKGNTFINCNRIL